LFSLINCLIQGQVGMLQSGKGIINGCVGSPKFLRDAAAGSNSTVTLVGSNSGSTPFIAGDFRACEQRCHNFSDITGLNTSVLNEIAAPNKFSFAESVYQFPTRFIQPAAAWFVDTHDPWVHILGNLTDQRLLRLGREDSSGYGDYYYDFWRKTADGRLQLEGNQTGFIGLDFNGDIKATQLAMTKTQPLTPGATVTMDILTGNVFTITPGENETINATNLVANKEITLHVLTSGAVSYNITFGTNFISQGVLATGGTTAKHFIVKFLCDGTNLIEESRTPAM